MPSYKEHILASIIMVFPFFPEVFYIALAVVGASIIDMDHKVNQKNIIIMGLLGVMLSLLLYISKMSYLTGILIALMAVLFYISDHRGFMHSILGIIFITGCLSFFVFDAYRLLFDFNINLKISLIIILLILGIVILNKKLVPLFGFIIITGLIFSTHTEVNVYCIALAIFSGCLSHIILDLFTPSGVKILSPISFVKFKKLTGITLLGIWAGCAIVFIVLHGNNFFIIR